MITLYHRPQTRSSRFIFLLEELGAPLHRCSSSLRAAAMVPGLSIRPIRIRTQGAVDLDDGIVVFESAAITLYLTDEFPQHGIGPAIADRKRGEYLSWLAYYAGVFQPAMVSKFMKLEVPRVTAGWVAIEEVMPVILAVLARGPVPG